MHIYVSLYSLRKLHYAYICIIIYLKGVTLYIYMYQHIA